MKRFLIIIGLLWGCGSVFADTTPIKAKGHELYLSYGCALCHGWEGRGDGINAQKFDPPPANFHDLKTFHHGTDADSIRRSIQYGIKEDNSIMPAFEDIPPEELNQITTFLESLKES